MFLNRICRHIVRPRLIRYTNIQCLQASTSSGAPNEHSKKGAETEETAVIIPKQLFESVPQINRNKKAFEEAIGMFLKDNSSRRGHKEFIKGAIKYLEEYGVHKDLDTYKQLLQLFPRGKFVPENRLQVIMQHFPQEQDVCVLLLDEMEWHGVYPDREVLLIVTGNFGEWTHAAKKIKRMLYWMPRFRYACKWRPDVVPDNMRDVAIIAVKMMCRDPANRIAVWTTKSVEGSSEDTWIVSGQSPKQVQHIHKHPVSKPVYIDGPYRVYVREHPVDYFTLTADPDPNKFFIDFGEEKQETVEDWQNWEHAFSKEWTKERKALLANPSMHEQREGTVMAIGCTGTSSKESAAAWIRLLQKKNPRLADIPAIFRLKTVQDTPNEETEQPLLHQESKRNLEQERVLKGK